MKIFTMMVAAAMIATGAEKPKSAESPTKAEFARIAAGQMDAPTASSSTLLRHSGKARDLASSNPSFTVSDTWTSITVAAGASYKLTSTNDYTGSEQVSIAIECPTAVSLQNVGITVWWGIPIAPFLTLTDVVAGSGFLLKNMGGGSVSVYGNQIMLQVVNTGTTAISCDQVTTYAVVH
jgi:hypothetical protein